MIKREKKKATADRQTKQTEFERYVPVAYRGTASITKTKMNGKTKG